jgi:hypothetical protein
LGSIGSKFEEKKEAEEKLRCQLAATVAKEEALKERVFKLQNESNAKMKAIEDRWRKALFERESELNKWVLLFIMLKNRISIEIFE